MTFQLRPEGRAEVSRVQAENAFWAEGPARAKGLRQEVCSRMLVSWGCCRRRAQTGSLAQQELARSRFGRPEVQSGCGLGGSPGHSLGRSAPGPSPSVPCC